MNSNGEKRKRQVGAYHKCCAVIVGNVVWALEEEKRDHKLKFGINQATERGKAYLGMSSSTISRLA